MNTTKGGSSTSETASKPTGNYSSGGKTGKVNLDCKKSLQQSESLNGDTSRHNSASNDAHDDSWEDRSPQNLVIDMDVTSSSGGVADGGDNSSASLQPANANSGSSSTLKHSASSTGLRRNCSAIPATTCPTPKHASSLASSSKLSNSSSELSKTAVAACSTPDRLLSETKTIAATASAPASPSVLAKRSAPSLDSSGIRMKIKRKKMATRQSSAKHEVIALRTDDGVDAVSETSSLLDEATLTPSSPSAISNAASSAKIELNGLGLTRSHNSPLDCRLNSYDNETLNCASERSEGFSDSTRATAFTGFQRTASPKANELRPNGNRQRLPPAEAPINEDDAFTNSKTAPTKLEKRDAQTWVRTISTAIEPQSFGECSPGSAVTLDGIVWNETNSGMLVVNVTWRGQTYVGTLLSSSKFDWACPRFALQGDENENARCGKGRGKKGRLSAANKNSPYLNNKSAAVNGSNASPEKSANLVSNPDSEESNSGGRISETNGSKLSSTDQTLESARLTSSSPILYSCTVRGCAKRFDQVNALKYHFNAAHRQRLKHARRAERTKSDTVFGHLSVDCHENAHKRHVQDMATSPIHEGFLEAAHERDEEASKATAALFEEFHSSTSPSAHFAASLGFANGRHADGIIRPDLLERRLSSGPVCEQTPTATENKLPAEQAESLEKLFEVVNGPHRSLGRMESAESQRKCSDGAVSPAYSDISDANNDDDLADEGKSTACGNSSLLNSAKASASSKREPTLPCPQASDIPLSQTPKEKLAAAIAEASASTALSGETRHDISIGFPPVLQTPIAGVQPIQTANDPQLFALKKPTLDCKPKQSGNTPKPTADNKQPRTTTAKHPASGTCSVTTTTTANQPIPSLTNTPISSSLIMATTTAPHTKPTGIVHAQAAVKAENPSPKPAIRSSTTPSAGDALYKNPIATPMTFPYAQSYHNAPLLPPHHRAPSAVYPFGMSPFEPHLYHQAATMFNPAALGGFVPPPIFPVLGSHPAGLPPPPVPPPEIAGQPLGAQPQNAPTPKALDILQRASQYLNHGQNMEANTSSVMMANGGSGVAAITSVAAGSPASLPPAHKIHELAAHARHSPGSPLTGSKEYCAKNPANDGCSTKGVSQAQDGLAEQQRMSPPIQRHLHTHHHTHTFPTLQPPLDAYTAMYQAGHPASAVLPSYPTK